MKRYFAVLASAMFCVVCFSLYLMLETSNISMSRDSELGEMAMQNDMDHVEQKIKQIETDLRRNHDTINLIKEAVRDISRGDASSLKKLQDALENNDKGIAIFQSKLLDGVLAATKGAEKLLKAKPFNVSFETNTMNIAQDKCQVAHMKPSLTDTQMMDVFEEIPFDNPDGGVWKQGYNLFYEENKWKNEKLKVFVVPHSHNDPGWIKTFDRYYNDQTKHILNNMLEKLEQYPRMKFIYAEMSFFSLWWNELDATKRNRVKKLLSEGRLELVTGGWVMTDEANAHFFSMLDQIIEGNTWMKNELGVSPNIGWAIDPFGHTPTMPYILKRSGFSGMLIQRVHYAVKKYLAKKQTLEFNWRQTWDTGDSTDMFCHMMPFYSYDVPHTCGPDPKICCQFDFKRLPGGRIVCPWKVNPVQITNDNVREKSRQLVDQYMKKSTLYKNNVVLIPLGDDFRYDKANEWDNQYSNYVKMFDYINNNMDVEIQFGTLTDYFKAVHERSGVEFDKNPKDYPSLSGDFFPYNDREDHYWTGYFTSRPFYKNLDRVLESHLRSSEILVSLAKGYAKQAGLSEVPGWPRLMRQLVEARRGLGLYQHHDGITGTAKDFVVADYGIRMLNGLKNCKNIILELSGFLLSKHKASYSDATPYFNVDDERATHDSLPTATIVQVSSTPRPIAFFNSLAHARSTVVRIHTETPHVMVKDLNGNIVVTQVDPFWSDTDTISKSRYKVAFVVAVPALGITKYTIEKSMDNPHNYRSEVSMYNSARTPKSDDFIIKVPKVDSFTIENSELRVTYGTSDGLLQSMTSKGTKSEVKTKMEFRRYGSRPGKEKSGAYLFLPNGEAKPLMTHKPLIRMIRGPLVSEIQSFIDHITHAARLYNSGGSDSVSLDIVNMIDIRSETNAEYVMHIDTDINSGDEFYTDLNGFQVLRRKTHKKIPLQGNFYPMPMMAYIQDNKARFSILTGQSLGVASLQSGQLEVVQDRRLNQDDGRGLGQGVLDNKLTPNKFRLLLEFPLPNVEPSPKQLTGYPSLQSHLASQELVHQLHILPSTGAVENEDLNPIFSPLLSDLPCEIHLLNFRTMQAQSDESAMLLHHLGFDCAYPVKGLQCPVENGHVSLDVAFRDLHIKSVQPTSLSLVHDGEVLTGAHDVTIPPMEIEAYKVKFS